MEHPLCVVAHSSRQASLKQTRWSVPVIPILRGFAQRRKDNRQEKEKSSAKLSNREAPNSSGSGACASVAVAIRTPEGCNTPAAGRRGRKEGRTPARTHADQDKAARPRGGGGGALASWPGLVALVPGLQSSYHTEEAQDLVRMDL